MKAFCFRPIERRRVRARGLQAPLPRSNKSLSSTLVSQPKTVPQKKSCGTKLKDQS
jgi:hypothetical protein